MNIVEIISMVNQLAMAANTIGLSFNQLASLQQRAEDEGRELSVEDVRVLRDGARERLDALDEAIRAAEEADDNDN